MDQTKDIPGLVMSTDCYWKWPSRNSGFTHENSMVDLSIATLNYQRVVLISDFSSVSAVLTFELSVVSYRPTNWPTDLLGLDHDNSFPIFPIFSRKTMVFQRPFTGHWGGSIVMGLPQASFGWFHGKSPSMDETRATPISGKLHLSNKVDLPR